MNLLRYRSPTVDEAYRRFVVPLSIFFIFGGMIGVPISCFAPITGAVPFVTSERLNRLLFVLISMFLAADGIGLLLRNRIAWYAMLAYCCVGAVIPILAAYDSRFREQFGGYEPAVLGTAFNSIIAVGLYLGTRPVFVPGYAKSSS